MPHRFQIYFLVQHIRVELGLYCIAGGFGLMLPSWWIPYHSFKIFGKFILNQKKHTV